MWKKQVTEIFIDLFKHYKCREYFKSYMLLKFMVLGALSRMGELGSNVFHPDYTTGIPNSKCSFQNSFYGTFANDVVSYFHIVFIF